MTYILTVWLSVAGQLLAVTSTLPGNQGDAVCTDRLAVVQVIAAANRGALVASRCVLEIGV